MLKIAPEGYPFIGVFLALAVVAAFTLNPKWAVAPFALMLFMVFFFRDPERVTPEGPGFLSPADGRVLEIKREREGEFIKDEVIRISIFMSPLNVHVNRAPCEGEVISVRHTPGSFLAAYRQEASWKNENTAMLLGCGERKVLVRQVAGFLARRTVCRVRPGERLLRGQRYGMIKFSSRLDVYLPPDAVLRVREDDRVRAGETILALPAEER